MATLPESRVEHGRGAVAAVVVIVLLAAGCSSSSGSRDGASSTPPSSASSVPSKAPTSVPRPAGPAATISGPITGGKGISLLSASVLKPATLLRESEYFASGTAVSYTAASRPASGRWSLTPGASASYRTRIIVRTPKDSSRFNGTVLVEWLNVSVGSDTDPDYSYSSAEIERGGYAYVGVSAQQVGIDGSRAGDIASQLLPGLGVSGLRKTDPVRYASLRHPGDAYSYDIFTQVTRALRAPGPLDALGRLRPSRVIALGESQSASALTSYVDGVQPLTREFDGFFIHSRGGGAAPLGGTGDSGSIVDGSYRVRTDIGVPVLIFETETDIALLRYDRGSQPDSRWVHVWEVAGTSHADAFVVGPAAGLLGCGPAINSGPQQYVVKAAVSALQRWVTSGKAPAPAPRLEHTGSVLRRDAHGIALGGIRTPPVDVPVAVQSGVPADASKVICALFGSARPLSAAVLHQLYASKAQFLAEYDRAADRSISAGYVLAADRPALVAEARKANL